MSNAQFVAGMLSWRRAFVAGNVEVAAAVKAEWESWLNRQRTEPPEPSKPLLIAVVHLSSIDDLTAHIGLAQMLAFRELRYAVVLAFPTAAMASIARGEVQLKGWQGLVKIVDDAGCDRLIEQLVWDTPLLLFPGQAIFDLEFVRNQLAQRHFLDLARPVGDATDAKRGTMIGKAFLGRARDYSEWKQSQTQPDWGALVRDLASSKLSLPDLGISVTPEVRAKIVRWQAPKRPWVQLETHRDRMFIPGVGSGDEFVVRTANEPFHSQVIERWPTQFVAAEKPFPIRLPASMLGPAPRLVRVETHKRDGEIIGQQAVVHVGPSQLQPWMLSCFLNRGGGGNPVVRAFAGAIGTRLAYAEDEPEVLRHVPVVWGVLRESDRILAQAKAQSLYFLYIDHAYFDRGHGRSYRITRNGYEAGAVRRCPSDRFRALGIETQPWRKSGREIVVCPPTDYFMQAHGCLDWLETTLAMLKAATDRPIVVREKPKDTEAAVPLPVALESAHSLVTHSSNVAIEAVCLGTPVFVSPASAAAPVGLTELSQIEDPVYPDRDAWLAHLAYSQFSLEEIADGRAWRMLLELEERDLA
ncbi:hypothetical protein G7077_03235 [Sphingomonas piscis]|uniref:Uncharacterized protein n=1 Tax=Sphingomonas piscis TaxID=2714943 RepID=A0A6G7YMV8_9SPHN|nr:hypothetical protein [Sphingomonas piscis]QIK78071.1 hypothetical protein G7077_03235 [Sphingomonas piscis]